jgi:hypothetical protein
MGRSNLSTKYLMMFMIICISANFLSSLKTQNYALNKQKIEPVTTVTPMAGIAAQGNSVSVASGNTAATISDAKAQATTGRTAVGMAGAAAKTDTVETQSGVVAVAEAGNNEKLVQSHAYQETTAQKTYGQQKDAGVENIASTSYLTGTTQRTDLNDQTSTFSAQQYQVGQEKKLTNQQQTVTDKSTQTSTLESFSGAGNKLSQNTSKDIVITIDTGAEKLIIEKLIRRDDRVIIVTAAKYIKSSLITSEIAYIQQLIAGTCNCKKVKDYVIEMLAEAN